MKDTKNRYRTSRKRKRTQKPWPILLAVGGLILVAAAVLITGRGETSPKTPVEVRGQPSLKVDREQVDFGEVQFEQPVSVTFTLSNVGDQTLRFSEQPYIEVLEGCWPPKPAIGSMALKPGESTTLQMSFTMHEGMGGAHDFRVHIPNNDPDWGDRSLAVLSNWVE